MLLTKQETLKLVRSKRAKAFSQFYLCCAVKAYDVFGAELLTRSPATVNLSRPKMVQFLMDLRTSGTIKVETHGAHLTVFC